MATSDHTDSQLDVARQKSDGILSLRGVARRFSGRDRVVAALEDINLEIGESEFITIVGPSGCGKSTLLNLLAGLLPPSEGTLLYKNKPIAGVNRSIGYITQQDNLFPWLTLIDNVAFPLELVGVPKSERHARAEIWLKRVGLSGFETAYPHELSGGMRQRGNIIRTLIYEPSVILMDEPFGPLDAQTRITLQNLLLSIWDTARSTVVFITHDLTEAIALADRVVLMSARPGRLIRVDTVNIPRPRDIFFIHSNPEFRRLYDEIWRDLAIQVHNPDEQKH